MASFSNRNPYFDNAKFILIFLVVFGHVISPLKENNHILFTLYSFIFLFHMPAFILISGHFSKGYKKKGYLFKIIKKILLPYMIFQAVYSIFYFIDGDEPYLQFDFLQPHWTLWFLLSLFCWNLLLYVFARFKWIGFVLALAIGIGINYFDTIGSFLSLSRTFVFFPYFLLGFLLEPKHFKLIKDVKNAPIIGMTLLLCSALLVGVFFPKDAIPWLLGDTSYADMGVEKLVNSFIRVMQYIVTIIVICAFLVTVPSNRFKLTMIGQRTLYIYLLHGFIIKSIQTVVSDDTLNRMSNHYVILIVFSLGICCLLGNYVIQKYTRPLIELRI